MGSFEIIKRNGEKVQLQTREPFCAVKSAVQNTSLMGDDNVQISFVSRDLINLEKGDKILVFGDEYTLRTKAAREMLSETHYTYEATFYGVMYELMKSLYRNTDASGKSTKSTFDLTYSIKDFIKVLIYNVERDYPGLWKFDEENCPETEPITIQFSKQNCLQVLQTLCSKECFNLEFRITNANGVRTIHIGKFGSKVVPPGGNDFFEWGKGNGLYKLKEEKVDDKAIITRLWVEGGTTNIRSGYRGYSERLQLPYPKRLNKKEHTLADGTVIPAESEYIGIDDDTKRYFEDAELREMLGSDEDSKEYDNIHPTKKGEVTALVDGDVNSFIDNTMDFDLCEKDSKGTKYLISGVTAKINFISGKLAGQQFEIAAEGGYIHSEKKFKLIPFTDERGLTIPTTGTNEAFRISVGDEYKITDINLPESYEQAAEEELWYAGYDDFLYMKQARAQYQLTLDRKYFVDNLPEDSDTTVFKVGDYVPVRDTRFGIEKNIRIQKVSRNLLLEHDYALTLSDVTAISVYSQTVVDVIKHNQIIENNRLMDLNKARKGWRTTEELRNMVYDTDGYFDTENIRPNSIDTNMLTVGSKSQQFVLIDVILEPNFSGLGNRLNASAGVLAHLSIEDDGVRQWIIGASEFTMANSGGYYLFAKCSKTGDSGVWYLTQKQLKFEPTDDPNNYYFQVGILSSLYEDGFRDFVTTYGFTRINGNTITTGKIVTADGENYLDLDGNKFRIGDSRSSVDWNVTAKNQLTLHNVRLLSDSGDTATIGVYRGVYNSSYTYYYGDEVSYTSGGATNTYRYTNKTATKGIAPTNTTYWSVIAQGANGQDGQDGVTYYTWIKYSDVANPTTTSQIYDTPKATTEYIGIAVNQTTQTEGTDPSKYTWSKFKGDQGVPGQDGTDGQDGDYFEYRYAVNGSTSTPPSLVATSRTPSGWSTTQPTVGALQYLWRTMAKISGSKNTLLQNWSTPVRVTPYNGVDGKDGTDGVDGKDGVGYNPNILRSADFNDLTQWESHNGTVLPDAIDGVQGFYGKYDSEQDPTARGYIELAQQLLVKSGNVGFSRLNPSTWYTLSFWAKKSVDMIAVGETSNKYGFAMKQCNLHEGSAYKIGVYGSISAVAKAAGKKLGVFVFNESWSWSKSVMIDTTSGSWGWISFNDVPTTGIYYIQAYLYDNTRPSGVDVGTATVEYYQIDRGGMLNTYLYPSLIDTTADYIVDGSKVASNPTDGLVQWKLSTVWEKHTVTFKTKIDIAGAYQSLLFRLTMMSDTTYVCMPKLERGTDASAFGMNNRDLVGSSPALVYRGDYKADQTYYGTNTRVDAVKYNGVYFVARVDAGSFSNYAPTDERKWNHFGAQFESIATSLLLAENANIANWIFRDGMLYSQTGDCYLNGITGEISTTGFIRKKMLHITQDNISTYTEKINIGTIYEDTIINWHKAGSLITVDYFPDNYVCYLPSISPGVLKYTEDDANLARSYIGSMMIIYNKSGRNISVSGRCAESDSNRGVSIVIENRKLCVFQCKIGFDSDGREDIYWLFAKGTPTLLHDPQ